MSDPDTSRPPLPLDDAGHRPDAEQREAGRRLAAAVDGTGLDRLAHLAARLLRAPSAQLSLLTDDQLVAAGAGLAPGSVGSTGPLDESLCTVTVAGARPLVVSDAVGDDRVRRLPPVTTGQVGSYLGVPVASHDGHLVGALCVFGAEAREWTDADVAVLTELAAAAATELELSAMSADYEMDRLRWQLAVTAGGVGSFDWDLRTGALVWDDRLLEIFGYTREHFGGTIEAFSARLHPDDAPRVDQALRDAIARCGPYEAEYRVVLPAGPTRWVQARGLAIAGSDGVAARVLGVAYDTTGNRDSDVRLARVLESMSAAFYSLDAEWRFTYVNAEAERLLERPREELLGGDIWELFPAAVGSPFEEHYRSAVASGRSVTFEAYYPAPLDGWYELRAWPTPEGLSVYFLDITARRAAQEAAEQALEHAGHASRRLELIAAVSADLAETLDVEAALVLLGGHLVPGLGDWCIISVVEDGRARDIGSWHRDPSRQALLERYADTRMEHLDPVHSQVARVIASGRPSLVAAPALDAILPVLGSAQAREHLRELAPSTAAVLPLRGRGRTNGLITLVRGADRPELDGEDLLAALELADRAGLALDNARLYGQQQHIAEGLQRSLLTAPVEPEHMEVVVRYQPASEAARVGGDWYDAFLQPDGATVLVIGDVMGHDVEAAADMSQVRSILRGIAYATGATPATILRTLDAAMEGLAVDTTATAVVARVEQDAGDEAAGRTRLRWSNAGHPPPLVLTPGGEVVTLDGARNDLLLGVAPSWERTEHEIVLERGSTVLLYTDGLVERRARTMDEGLQRVRAALVELAHESLDELVDGILHRLLRGRQDDDVALVAIRLHPQGERDAGGAPPRDELRLPPVSASVRTARHWVAERAAAQGVPDPAVQTLALLTSEIVTNAVKYGPADGTVVLTGRRSGDLFEVSVRDDSPEPPVRLDVGPGHLGGHGVRIVQGLVAEWGVELHGEEGKTVSFAVPLDARLTPG